MVPSPYGSRLWRAVSCSALLLAAPISLAQAQSAVINGTVTVLGSTTPISATIAIQSLGVSTTANEQGRYTLTVPAENVRGQSAIITARFIGYEPITRTITLSAGAQNVNFELKSDPFRLSEVIVTGTTDGQSKAKIPFSVATVNEAQLRDVPATSPVAALAGKVAGARIALGTGNPGSAPAIRLRGSTSLGVGNSTPLIIIDGVITRFSIADIDAQDIESIEVLKGAAASAFYGSDAANGVLAITTKRGKDIAEGTVRMSIRSEYGTTDVVRYVPLNQSHNFLVDASGQIVETSPGTRALDPDGIADNPYPTTGINRARNQLQEWLQDGNFYSTNFQLGYRGGSTNLNSSFTTDHNSGIIPFRSGQFRQSARINVDQRINSKADFGTSLTYTLNNNDYDPSDNDGWFSLLQAPPDVDLANPNNDPSQVKYYPRLPGFVPNARGNPLYQLANQEYKLRRERLLGSATLRYRPVEWLRLDAQYGTDRSNRGQETYNFKGYLTGDGVESPGSLNIFRANDVAENMQGNAIVTKQFGELLSTSRVTYLAEKQTASGVSASGNNLTVVGVRDLDAIDPLNNSVGSSTQEIYNTNVFFSQGFDFRDKYIADFLIRRDGSSLFGADNRYATFYRVAGAWRISEDFQMPGIQELKLRAARGTAGLRPNFANQYETYSISGGVISKAQLGNPNLRPALQTEDEIGLEVAFASKFSAELVYASRKTEDAFLNVPLSLAQNNGFSTQVQNAATVSAKTLELLFQANLVDRENLGYNVTLTADRTRQRIDSLGRAPYRVNAGGQSQNVFYYKQGEVLGVIYGKRWLRTLDEISAQGLDASLYTVNSDGYPVLASSLGKGNERPVAFVDENGSDQVQIGNVNPEFSFGIAQNLRFKRFSAYALIDGVRGGDIYNFTKQWMFQDGRHGDLDQAGRPLAERRPNSWYGGGLYDGLNANSYFVEDGSYARLREFSVAYNVDPNLLSRIGLGTFNQGMKISLVGRNLLTWTNYTGFDPEATSGGDFNFRIDGFRYPNFRTITAMIDVSF